MNSVPASTALDHTTAAVLLRATTRADLQARVIGLLPPEGILDLLRGEYDLAVGVPDILVEAFLDRLEDAAPPAVHAAPEVVLVDTAVEVVETVSGASPAITEAVPVDVAVPSPAKPETPKAPRYDAQAAANRIEQSVGPRPQAAGVRREWSQRLDQEIADELWKIRITYGSSFHSTNARFRQLCIAIESRTREKIDRVAIKALADAAPASSP